MSSPSPSAGRIIFRQGGFGGGYVGGGRGGAVGGLAVGGVADRKMFLLILSWCWEYCFPWIGQTILASQFHSDSINIFETAQSALRRAVQSFKEFAAEGRVSRSDIEDIPIGRLFGAYPVEFLYREFAPPVFPLADCRVPQENFIGLSMAVIFNAGCFSKSTCRPFVVKSALSLLCPFDGQGFFKYSFGMML